MLGDVGLLRQREGCWKVCIDLGTSPCHGEPAGGHLKLCRCGGKKPGKSHGNPMEYRTLNGKHMQKIPENPMEVSMILNHSNDICSLQPHIQSWGRKGIEGYCIEDRCCAVQGHWFSSFSLSVHQF